MNVRKLIARLNATSLRLPDGRPKKQTTVGGTKLSHDRLMAMGADLIDERMPNLQRISGVESITRVHGWQTWSWDPDKLTALDIAGALGMCTNGLAREVFCAIWWPDGAKLAAAELSRALIDRLREEATGRKGAALDAWLRVEFAKADVRLSGSAEGKRDAERALSRAQTALKAARSHEWPIDGERYAQLLGAALRNIGEARPCHTCHGERTVLLLGKPTECAACKGRGQRPVITEEIADSIGITRQSFHERWRGVYEWLHDDLSALERIGASQLADALQRDELRAA